MNIFISQVYIEAGINYPFSHHFQKWLGQQLSSRVKPSQLFCQIYSEDFKIIFRMNAKSKMTVPEIRGPTIFKRDKSIEYTIFLPCETGKLQGRDEYEKALERLFDGIALVLRELGLDPSTIAEDASALIQQILSNPIMFTRKN